MKRPTSDGPTGERLLKSGGAFTDVGRGSARRVTMNDDPLGRAWMRQKISDGEYWALRLYARHWTAGGLAGGMQSVDLDRILAFDPASMTGLAKTEAQQDHRDAYHAATREIGYRPAFVAQHVACLGSTLQDVGLMLGYQSVRHGREVAGNILADAGHRLGVFWKDYRR